MVKSDSSSDPDQGDKTFLPSKIKSERKKTAKGMKMLAYCQALSDDARREILENLRQDKDEEDYVENSRKTPTFFSSADASKSESEKVELYDMLIQEKCKAKVTMKYGNKNVPSHELRSGLLINLATRTDKDLCNINIILRKHDRGSDAILCKKARDKVVESLDLKILADNISRLLTSTDVAEYNIAADILSWQTTFKSIHHFCSQYNMPSLIMIPQDVQLSKPHLVAKATVFKDAIRNWQDVDNQDYFLWQEFILRFGTAIEIESDNWLDNVLHLSMEKTLLAEVDLDINSIPKHQRGLITTLRYIIKRMVIKNQEAKDALENYIRSFDITKFPGKNVPTACLCLKVVAGALGDNDLPTNTIRKVLEGFEKSLTTSFNDFCSSQIALHQGSF
jgi:hypothetical protein